MSKPVPHMPFCSSYHLMPCDCGAVPSAATVVTERDTEHGMSSEELSDAFMAFFTAAAPERDLPRAEDRRSTERHYSLPDAVVSQPEGTPISCAICGAKWGFNQTHVCELEPKLTEEERRMVSACLVAEGCDHFCCGMTPELCHAKTIISTLRAIAEDELASPTPVVSQNGNSRVLTVGNVSIGCMLPEARELLDVAMERWKEHRANVEKSGYVSDDQAYSFAYWLFRWSGLIPITTPVVSGQAETFWNILTRLRQLGMFDAIPDKDRFYAAWESAKTIPAPPSLPKAQNEWPKPCDLCGKPVFSKDDWAENHGLGDCVEVCTRCDGSGQEPTPKAEPCNHEVGRTITCRLGTYGCSIHDAPKAGETDWVHITQDSEAGIEYPKSAAPPLLPEQPEINTATDNLRANPYEMEPASDPSGKGAREWFLNLTDVPAGLHGLADMGALYDVMDRFVAFREQPVLKILHSACDRAWESETLYQTAVVASNAIHWRDTELASLRQQLSDSQRIQSAEKEILVAEVAKNFELQGKVSQLEADKANEILVKGEWKDLATKSLGLSHEWMWRHRNAESQVSVLTKERDEAVKTYKAYEAIIGKT